MKTDKIIRIRLSSYRKIRRVFSAYPGESLSSYFKRLANYLEGVQIEWSGYDERD